ncbi:sigma-70 family RNA polymerase sigma factor, partial [Streptomyces sp. NPDC050804]|uniref:sigma-70 family RNA polymerase sigma factor n=1 Tax=Streptomyces sp. NPDC050804 TaxID=3154745 RepID=UPI00343E4B6E
MHPAATGHRGDVGMRHSKRVHRPHTQQETDTDTDSTDTGADADADADRQRVADEAFIRAIYDKHGTTLLRVTTGLLNGDTHRAEDIVQEAVLRAWRHAHTLDPHANGIRPWLITVIRNLIIDNHRARQARPPETTDTILTDMPAPEHTDQALTKKLVLEALHDLTPAHREILLHVQYLDHTVTQTATTLGIPPGTVKSRTHLALRALKQALTHRGYT